MSNPRSDTWSGTSGHPTAPSSTASKPRRVPSPSAGIIDAFLAVPAARPVELHVGQSDAVPGRDGVEHLPGGPDHLRADAVARDDRDAVRRTGHQPPIPSNDTMTGRATRMSTAPSTSNEMPDLIILVIGTTPEP